MYWCRTAAYVKATIRQSHDCEIGDNCILANCVNLAGHVTIENNATLEGLVAIALLLGGGLSALQGAAVSTGIPFTLVVLIMLLLAAAWGLTLAMNGQDHLEPGAWRRALETAAARLRSARPTAVNLAWALAQQLNAIDAARLSGASGRALLTEPG